MKKSQEKEKEVLEEGPIGGGGTNPKPKEKDKD